MFWLIITSPLVVLGVTAGIVRHGVLFRTALILLVLYFILDCILLYQLVGVVGRSTDPITLALIAVLELITAILLLVVGIIFRAKSYYRQQKDRRSTSRTGESG